MTLPIYLYGQPVLRKISQKINADYPELTTLIENMWETLYASDGVGLAAPQIGLDIRLLVIDLDPLSEEYPAYEGYKVCMINPEIKTLEGEIVNRNEACLSLPGISENVPRQEKLVITYLNERFEERIERFEGFSARVVQHEYDHLEGKMLIDHISPIRKQLIKGKLNNILTGKAHCDYRTKSIK